MRYFALLFTDSRINPKNVDIGTKTPKGVIPKGAIELTSIEFEDLIIKQIAKEKQETITGESFPDGFKETI